jgi:hypothetical protein
VCTENLVRIDLMKESLNVGQDARADISLSDTEPREVRSQTTFSCTHGPLRFRKEVVLAGFAAEAQAPMVVADKT